MKTPSLRTSAMRCADVNPLLAVRDELDAPSAAAVTAHVDACPACAAALADEQRVVAALRNLAVYEAPPGLESRLLALPTTSPLTFGPVLTERVVWLLIVAATALTAWSLWQAGVRQPDGLRPGVLPSVADSGNPSNRDPGVSAGHIGAEQSPDEQTGLKVASRTDDAAPVSGQPTVVARLRPIDLRRQPAVDVVSSAAGLVAKGRTPVRNAPPERGPRAPVADRAAVPPGEGDGGGADNTPKQANGPEDNHSPAPSDANERTVTPMGTVAPTAPPPATPASICAGQTVAGQTAAGQMVTVRVRVVADVAGAGSADCAGCDGRFDEIDQAALVTSGAQMPVLQVAYYSKPQPDITGETTVLNGDSRYASPGELMVEFEPKCIAADQWPVVAVVRLTSEDWAYCAVNGAEIVLEGPDAPPPTFYLHPVCPIVPAPDEASP